MPSAIADGLTTHYELVGNGPPLLMFSPAGFDATADKWATQGVYAKTRMLEQLAEKYTCVTYDRRESGASGGRVERIRWSDYAAQAKGLLDHLGISRAHLLGGCMGCPPVLAFALGYPQMTASMVLYWPVGGARFRINTRQRFAEHLAFVREAGLAKVVEVVRAEGKAFGADPRGGPWAPVIKRDPDFARAFARQDVERYVSIVKEMARTLFDRDTSPGAEPENLMRLDVPALIVPGNDASHATSAARYLHECLPQSQYWDAAPDAQTAESAPPRIMEFLARSSTEERRGGRSPRK